MSIVTNVSWNQYCDKRVSSNESSKEFKTMLYNMFPVFYKSYSKEIKNKSNNERYMFNLFGQKINFTVKTKEQYITIFSALCETKLTQSETKRKFKLFREIIGEREKLMNDLFDQVKSHYEEQLRLVKVHKNEVEKNDDKLSKNFSKEMIKKDIIHERQMREMKDKIDTMNKIAVEKDKLLKEQQIKYEEMKNILKSQLEQYKKTIKDNNESHQKIVKDKDLIISLMQKALC